MREHVVISIWFGIVDSLCPCQAFLFSLCRETLSPDRFIGMISFSVDLFLSADSLDGFT